MQYLAIIALFFIGCRTANTGGTADPDTFMIIVQFYQAQAEQDVMNVLNNRTIIQRFDVRHPNIFQSELEATCTKLKHINTDALWEELRHTAGVSNVVLTPADYENSICLFADLQQSLYCTKRFPACS